MGRGVLILTGFAAALSALVYFGPLDLSSLRTRTSTAALDEPDDEPAADDTGRFADEPTNARIGVAAGESPPVRKPRKQVLVATPAPKLANDRTASSSTEDASSVSDSKSSAATDGANRAPAASPKSATDLLPEKVIRGFPPRPTALISNDQIASVIKQAKLLREQGKLIEARDKMSELYLGHRLSSDQRQRVAGELEPLAWQLLTSHEIVSDGQVYTVAPGDTLGKIAKPFHVPPEFIARINQVRDARSIQPRQKLRLVEGPFDVLIEADEFELTVLQKGKFVRRCRVAIGKDDKPTPRGEFTVNSKLVNPEWNDPATRRKIPGGDAANQLGSRWIGFAFDYGIHGTNDPASIGSRASRGCIRMRNEDVELLFDMLGDGAKGTRASRVVIR